MFKDVVITFTRKVRDVATSPHGNGARCPSSPVLELDPCGREPKKFEMFMKMLEILRKFRKYSLKKVRKYSKY